MNGGRPVLYFLLSALWLISGSVAFAQQMQPGDLRKMVARAFGAPRCSRRGPPPPARFPSDQRSWPIMPAIL